MSTYVWSEKIMYKITNKKAATPFFIKNHSKTMTKKSFNKKVTSKTSDILQKQIINKVKMKKIPFSHYIHIDCFLHNPIYGTKTKHNLKFYEERSEQSSHQQQFTTSTYYQEQPFCKLTHSNISILTDINNIVKKQSENKGTLPEYFTTPLSRQNTSIELVTNSECINTEVCLNALLPIVLGEYKTEFIINTSIPFKRGISNIIDISKEIVLTNCEFLPTNYSHGTNLIKKYATKGTLFIEGYIEETIEFIPAFNQERKSPKDWIKDIFYQIDQVIMIELQILLLQQQVINSISSSR